MAPEAPTFRLFNWLARIRIPLGTVFVCLVPAVAVAALQGGVAGGWWTLSHGLAGPLSAAVLHDVQVKPVDLLLSALWGAAALAHPIRASIWTGAVTVLAVVSWCVLGWSTGV